MSLFESAREFLHAWTAPAPGPEEQPLTAESRAVSQQRIHEQRALARIESRGFDSTQRLELMRDEVLPGLLAVFSDCQGIEQVRAPLLRFPGPVNVMLEIVSASADRDQHCLKSRAEVLNLRCHDLILYHQLHYASDIVCVAEIDGSSECPTVQELSICQFEDGAELVEIDDGSLIKLVVGQTSANFPGARYPWQMVYRTCEEGALRVLTIDNEDGVVEAYMRKTAEKLDTHPI